MASLLFFCFAGWEAVTHLAGEFRHPDRDLRRATWLTLVVVGAVYLGVVAACFTAVTAFGLLAGIRLLPARTPAWFGVMVAAGVMLAVLLFSGWALAVPLGLAVAAVWAGHQAGRSVLRSAGGPGTSTTAVQLETVQVEAEPLATVPAAPPPARPGPWHRSSRS